MANYGDTLLKTILEGGIKLQPDNPLLDYAKTKTPPTNSLSDFFSAKPSNPNPFLDYLTGITSQPNKTMANSFLPPIQPLSPTGVKIRIAPSFPKTKAELIKKIDTDTKGILKKNLQIVQARKVPAPTEVSSNEAKLLRTSVLHIDMRKSSEILKQYLAKDALKIYQTFHAAMVSVSRFKNGRIRTFAGDRVGVVFDFYEKRQRSEAVETALSMQYVMEQIVNPQLLEIYGYRIEYGIGVDYGDMLVGRVGQDGATNNDLVWTGEAMTTASKLADFDGGGIYLSKTVFDLMATDLKDQTTAWAAYSSNYGDVYKYSSTPQLRL